MRVPSLTLGILVVGTFLVASIPTASAAAYCVQGVVNSYPLDDCDGLACFGQDQDGWTLCVPNICSLMTCTPDILCQFQSDCCQTVPVGSSFWCPDTE